MTQVQAEQKSPPAAPRARTRTCVGCGEQVAGDPGDLVRLVLGPEGQVAVDARGGGFGRGAYVHVRRACLERAVRGGLARSAKGKVDRVAAATPDVPGGALADSSSLSVDALARAIEAAMDRRLEGLLAAAVRSRQLAYGADAVTSACQRGEAALVVVARDARAAADLTEVRRAVAEGRAVAWGSKAEIGRLVAPGARRATLAGPPPDGEAANGEAGVAVVAVISGRMAGAVRDTALAAAACAEIACAPASEGGQRRPGGTRRGGARRSR
jgi:predicted RNA-binding protein YlxR (DUF448 family)/ribosomal protein L7Ae-like RNA K-turn-binding protein